MVNELITKQENLEKRLDKENEEIQKLEEKVDGENICLKNTIQLIHEYTDFQLNVSIHTAVFFEALRVLDDKITGLGYRIK